MRTYNDISRPDYTPEQITELKADEIFVFGSNLAGMHGVAAFIVFTCYHDAWTGLLFFAGVFNNSYIC